jgi:predicted phosphodiesterase
MTIAILSDIHGNLEAAVEVFRDLESHQPESIFFLGDAIGYGPDPDAAVQFLKDKEVLCLLGNHELALVNRWARRYFNKPTRRHFDRVKSLLSKDSRKFITTWPTRREITDLLFVHGCPPASVATYLFEMEDGDLAAALLQMDATVAFVGHTHELEIAELRQGQLERRVPCAGSYSLSANKTVVNIGSVGQPRDGDKRAKYALYDPRTREVEIRWVPYDAEKTARKICELGFSRAYAQRLL